MRKSCRKSSKVADQMEAKDEICLGRTRWIRELVWSGRSLLQVVLGCKPTFGDSDPFSCVHFKMCTQIHLRVPPGKKSFQHLVSYKRLSGIISGVIFLTFFQGGGKYMSLTLVFLPAPADRFSSVIAPP